MNPKGASDESLLRRMMEYNDESATLAMQVQLLRESPELCRWWWKDFIRDAKLRDRFAKMVQDTSSPLVGRFIELTDDDGLWQEECRRLRAQMPPGIYGGLTWSEVAQLVRHYQAGTIDLGVFLLAHDWRKAGKSSPLLKLAAIEFFELVMPSGRRRLLRHLEKALVFLNRYDSKATRRSALGYSDRWKMHVLLYMLRHPQQSYTTRELRAHVATLGFQINVKEMQRFCTRHGIRRDMRAGRPRKLATTKVAAPSIRPTGKRSNSKAGKL